MLRVAIVSGHLHPAYGGPWSVVDAHQRMLRRHVDVAVVGVTPAFGVARVAAQLPDATICRATWPQRWFRGAGLSDVLRRNADRFDVFHAHMLWDHAVWAAAHAARRARRPLVVTPHGSISDAWRTRALHKQIYRRIVLDRIIRDVGAFHALNQHEADQLRAWGITRRIEVIPNGLERNHYERAKDPTLAHQRWPRLQRGRCMLYLGRLSREKGLELLVDAWAAAGVADEWQLVVAGPDYRGFESSLRRRIARLGLEERIWLAGSVDGELKWSLLAAAEVFVLPSFGEGFSVALLEAMAVGIPAVYTVECHFPELADVGGGWIAESSLDALVAALRLVWRVDQRTFRMMGEHGRALGIRRFTLESVAERLAALYSSLA